MNIEPVRQAYASVADLYIQAFGTQKQVHADDLAFIGRHLGELPGTVLDLGCGPGHLTDYLCSLGADARGIDIVPEFIAHAQATYPSRDYQLGSIDELGVADGSVAGILSWFSSIHLPPHELDGMLGEFRRVTASGGPIVIGIFEGDEVAAFDHKVITAYRWPVDEFSAQLAKAGFIEVERMHRPSDGTHRPYAAIAAVATEG